MKRFAVFLLILAIVLSAVSVSGQESFSRRIHVADGGLVFVTDTVPVNSATETIRLGYPLDSAKNLAGYYLLNERGRFVERVDDVLWLEVSPETGWSGRSVSVVTVWRDMLVQIGEGKYLLVLPSNPIRDTDLSEIFVSFSSDGTPTINSVSGVELSISGDRRSANGTVKNIPLKQFKTLTISFDAPDLLQYTVEQATFLYDLEQNTVSVSMYVKNLGDASMNSVSLRLGREAKLVSAKSGIFNLGTSWSAETGTLDVTFLYSIGKNERTLIEVTYIAMDAVERMGERVEVKLPNLLNASITTLYVTLKTPPSAQVTSEREPWSLRVLDNNRREITFMYQNKYLTGFETVSVTYSPAFTFPVPVVLLAAIVVVAGFVAVKTTAAPRRTLSPQLRKAQTSLENAIDKLLKEVEMLKPGDKPLKTTKVSDEAVKSLRTELMELKKLSEMAQAYPQVEKTVEELLSIVSALSRSAEDYRAGRITGTVYQKIYDEYLKQVRRTAGRVLEVFDRLMRT
ncbi:MAG: hypothetical protein QXH32_07540 [Candidatus Caldarchaeum sp.]